VLACRRWQLLPTRTVLVVNLRTQTLALLERLTGPAAARSFPRYAYATLPLLHLPVRDRSVADSNCTRSGLHRIAEKIGGGQPVGTVFKGRQVVDGPGRACRTPRLSIASSGLMAWSRVATAAARSTLTRDIFISTLR